MTDTSLLRQVALVSYGNEFLRDRLPLEEWYRHGVFWNARLQFRALDGNALLAHDFTLWLGVLKASGALRLSLHLAAEFDLQAAAAERKGAHVVAVHFPDHVAVWMVRREGATWLAHPAIPEEARQTYPMFPNAAYYGGEIDSYWCVEQRQGRLAVPDTDWKQLGADIARDLDINVPSSLVPVGPFFASPSDQPDWARLPLFPSSGRTALAHRIVATLRREQATFANATHPKNESSPYQWLNAEDAAGMDDWGARLDRWMIEVLLRCANESGGSAFVRVPPPARRIVAAAPPEDAAASPASDPVTPPATPVPAGQDGKWGHRFAFLVALAVASLLVVAFAHVIARFPWVALLFSLPLAFTLRERRKKINK